MPECAKTHLQQSIISKFSGGGPPDPPLQGEGRGGEGGKREGGTGGKEEGRGGMGGEGRSTWALPP